MQGLAGWMARNQVVAFFIGAYLFSWIAWLPSVLGDHRGGVIALLFFVGVFGPWASAMVVTRVSGGSVRQWSHSIFRSRLGARWYAFALLVPAAIVALTSVTIAVAGVELTLSLLGDERLLAYLPTLLFCVLLNGGPEEPGWRGFALPRLQERMTPVRATSVLGVVWALWHLPLLLISEEGLAHGLAALPFALLMLWTVVGIAFGYSVFYTYLWNRTGSIVTSILLHASFNTANGVLLLVPEAQQRGSTYATIALAQTAILLIMAGVLVYRTGGRLGLGPPPSVRPQASSGPDRGR